MGAAVSWVGGSETVVCRELASKQHCLGFLGVILAMKRVLDQR